jgi:hypothetical protein
VSFERSSASRKIRNSVRERSIWSMIVSSRSRRSSGSSVESRWLVAVIERTKNAAVVEE